MGRNGILCGKLFGLSLACFGCDFLKGWNDFGAVRFDLVCLAALGGQTAMSGQMCTWSI